MRISLLTLTLGVALSSSSLAIAQAPGGPMPKPTPEQMAKFKEFQAVKSKLDSIRDTALEDKGLEKQEKALRDRIDAAMVAADPKAKEKREKFEALNAKFEAARAKNDMAAAQKIAAEVRPLLESLDVSRRKVMNDKAVTDAMDAFRSAVMAKMTKVDPETPKLLEKAERLSMELQAGMRPPMGGPAPAPAAMPPAPTKK